MFHPDDDVLADVALGEPVPEAVREHVAACDTCRTEVEYLTRTLQVLRSPAVELVSPPARVWAAVEAAVGASGPSVGTGRSAMLADDDPVTGAPGRSLHPVLEHAPEPVLMPSQVTELETRRDRRRPRRSFGAGWLVAAAVAGLVAGGVGVALTRDDDAPAADPSGVVLARASLDTLDTGTPKGTAELVERAGTTDLAVSTEPIAADAGYVEVWLINRDLKSMVSIGVLDPGATEQTFTVPRSLVDQGYVVVDISREPLDGDVAHSGDSVVRGTLAT